jgi:hypothetical protein
MIAFNGTAATNFAVSVTFDMLQFKNKGAAINVKARSQGTDLNLCRYNHPERAVVSWVVRGCALCHCSRCWLADAGEGPPHCK